MGADGMVGGAGAELHIMDMDMLARRDLLGGDADDLAQLAHRRPALDRLDGELMAAANGLGGGDVPQPHRLAHGQIPGRDHQGVGRIEQQHRGLVAPVVHGVCSPWIVRGSDYVMHN